MVTNRKHELPHVEHMTLAEKVGQMIMVRYHDVAILDAMLRRGHAGSFYFGMKGQSAQDVATTLNQLQITARIPAIVAFGSACTDCGTGLLRGDHMRVGATRSREIAYQLALTETREQRAYGFHIPGTPNLDVNTVPGNPIINTRSLGEDPALVSELGLEMLRGILDGRGVTCTMHFPGHGATVHDSHIQVPVDARPFEELWAVDLLPYREAIPRGLINGVCTNHVHYPALVPGDPAPSTISRNIVTGLLRERLGYDGVIMSDSLTMKPMKDAFGIEEAAILTVLAGHDIILQDYQSDPGITLDALARAVESGRIPMAEVDGSVSRILRLKQWLGLFDDPLVDVARIPERVAALEARTLAQRVAREAVTVLEDRALPLRVDNGKRCLLVTNAGSAGGSNDAGTGSSSSRAAQHLADALRRRSPQLTFRPVAEDVPPEQIDTVLEDAQEADAVVLGLFTRVVCYHENSIGLPRGVVDLVRRLAAQEKPLLLLNFGNPYVMADLPRGDGALCVYDHDCPESVDAAVEALCGEIPTTGKLPVTISPAYPYGFGKQLRPR